MKSFDTSNDHEALEELGLSKTEALIYLSALDLGQGTVSQIARNAGIERTGVYYHIDTLIRLNLLSEVSRGKRTLYLPADPKILKNILEHKNRLLEGVFPKIDRQFSLVTSRSITEYYYGIDRAKDYYNRLYQLLSEMQAPNNIIYILGNTYREVSRSHDFFLDFVPPEKQIDIKTKCILPKSSKVKATNQSINDQPYLIKRFNLPFAEVKYIPDKYAYYAAVAIVGNIICLFDFRNFSYSILENANVAKSWRAFHSFIWDHLPNK